MAGVTTHPTNIIRLFGTVLCTMTNASTKQTQWLRLTGVVANRSVHDTSSDVLQKAPMPVFTGEGTLLVGVNIQMIKTGAPKVRIADICRMQQSFPPAID